MIDPIVVSHDLLAYALAEPTKITLRGGDWSEAVKLALFRELGFRRIGDTLWFARAYEPTHPAHALLAHKDYDPLAPKPLTEDMKIEQRLEVLRTRIKRDGKIIDVSSEFQGHTDEDVRTLIAARKAMNSGAPTGFSQVKYGCNCGGCVGGFISPRMHFVLLKQLTKIYKGLFGSISADHSRSYLQMHPASIPEILGGYAWTFVQEPLKSLIFQHKDVGLGYCYVRLTLIYLVLD
jgi:hypothetical protein